MAEVIKYGMIRDAELLEALENRAWSDGEIIERCVRIKSEIVEADEYDNGCRQLLNYGHTLGHAVEKCSNFETAHGAAVAIGMAMVARAADAELAARLEALLDAYALPATCEYDEDALYEAALSDKKRRGGTLSLIVVETVGNGEVREIPVTELREYIRKGRAV
jgi:3-dehydroquinate synthase